MSDRIYNKLYVNRNRDEGSEKILLGYQHDGKELILKADKETYFHIPFYTKPISLKDSSLIVDGATGGPFPAASDRIFKNRKNFGNVTPNGDPISDVADGVWFCSWLYKDPQGVLRWMDRMYNPGSFKFSIAIAQLSEGPVYTPNDPIFRDVPSKMMFEPGVMYKYFHVGESTANNIVSTLGGLSGEYIKLDLKNWNTNQVNSVSGIEPAIATTATTSELYTIDEDPGRVTNPVIRFDNNKNTEVILTYNSSYCPTNEFTLAFWAQSPNWNDAQTTQLVGNFSSGGGYGVFVQTLSSYPFFVIPETNYGHVLYVNEGLIGYLDKSVQITQQIFASPKLIAIDFDQNVVVCNSDNSGTIYKIDNTGKIIASTKKLKTPFTFSGVDELPVEMLIGKNNSVIIRTNIALYTFNFKLELVNTLIQQTSLSAVSSYRYNSEADFFELDISNDVFDSKFIETTQWFIPRSDQNLYKKQNGNETLYHVFSDKATNVAIDPYDRLWVLHGRNSLTVIDSKSEPLSDPVLTTDVGLDINHEQKNISFFCVYDRESQTRQWNCVIYYSDEPYLYIHDMSGQLINTISILALFNSTTLSVLNQDANQFKFLAKGDFTGYEHRRIFKNLSPYNNQTQLVLRASLKDKTQEELTFTQFSSQASISNWDNDSWQHIIVTLRNKKFSVYVGEQLLMELPYSAQYELSYDNQPLFFIGSSAGSQTGFNDEIGYVSSIFNGEFEDIKIYNYCLENNKFQFFLRSSIPADDIYWTLPVPNIQYIETVERMFKNKLPGSKAPFYKIKLKGTAIQDTKTRQIIEDQIKQMVTQLQPMYVDLIEVLWVD
jgi:hypothetical protein